MYTTRRCSLDLSNCTAGNFVKEVELVLWWGVQSEAFQEMTQAVNEGDGDGEVGKEDNGNEVGVEGEQSKKNHHKTYPHLTRLDPHLQIMPLLVKHCFNHFLTSNLRYLVCIWIRI